jgi:SPP1 family predicted phage head-tail adaptor
VRAGKLDRVITIERVAQTLDAYGVPQETWSPVATLRAEIVDQSDDETIGEGGAVSKTVLTFRTRFLDGVTLADRVVYQGEILDLKGTKEIGRRRELEIRVQRLGP